MIDRSTHQAVKNTKALKFGPLSQDMCKVPQSWFTNNISGLQRCDLTEGRREQPGKMRQKSKIFSVWLGNIKDQETHGSRSSCTLKSLSQHASQLRLLVSKKEPQSYHKWIQTRTTAHTPNSLFENKHNNLTTEEMMPLPFLYLWRPYSFTYLLLHFLTWVEIDVRALNP